METIKNWLLSQGILMLISLAFALVAFVTSLIWVALDKVERSKLGITLRLMICIPAILIGWVTVDAMIGIITRNYPSITELAKKLFEGPWISIVIFKVIPTKGRYAAPPFVALYCILEGYIAFLGLFQKERAIFSVTEAIFALLAIVVSVGTYLILAKIYIEPNNKLFKGSKDTKKNSVGTQLARNLSSLYNEICIVSEKMQNCNNDFIQMLHEKFEDDKNYKNFKTAVLSTCYTVIQDETNLNEYINDLDKEIVKISSIVQNALNEFDDEKDFWKILAETGGQDRFNEVSEAFWTEHFLTAQRFVLGAWRVKQKGDSSYIYKGLE